MAGAARALLLHGRGCGNPAVPQATCGPKCGEKACDSPQIKRHAPDCDEKVNKLVAYVPHLDHKETKLAVLQRTQICWMPQICRNKITI